MEAGITGLAATADTVRLLVARAEPATELSIELSELGGTLVERVPLDRWHRTATRIRPVQSEFLFWTKPTIGGLRPATCYEATMVDGTSRRLATATVTTAPASDTDRLSLAVGSCFEQLVPAGRPRVLERVPPSQLADPVLAPRGQDDPPSREGRLSGMAVIDLELGDGQPIVTVNHIFGTMVDGEPMTSRKVNSFRWERTVDGAARAIVNRSRLWWRRLRW